MFTTRLRGFVLDVFFLLVTSSSVILFAYHQFPPFLVDLEYSLLLLLSTSAIFGVRTQNESLCAQKIPNMCLLH